MTLTVALVENTLGSYWSPNEFKEYLSKSKAAAVVVAEHMVVWMIWPLVFPVIGWELFNWLKVKRAEKYHSQFVLKPQHVYAYTSVEEAEARAFIEDPLGRVPKVPFGHLNAGWKSFIAKGQPGFELKRAFDPGQKAIGEVEKGPKWLEPRGRHEGYVWMLKKRIQAEFVFEWD